MMMLPPMMHDGRRSGHGRHHRLAERPDPVGAAMMRLHPVEATQTFGSLLGQAVQALVQRVERRSASAAR